MLAYLFVCKKYVVYSFLWKHILYSNVRAHEENKSKIQDNSMYFLALIGAVDVGGACVYLEQSFVIRLYSNY